MTSVCILNTFDLPIVLMNNINLIRVAASQHFPLLAQIEIASLITYYLKYNSSYAQFYKIAILGNSQIRCI